MMNIATCKPAARRAVVRLLAILGVLLLALPARALTVGELQALQKADSDITLIDIRQASDYAQGHIANAINVPASIITHKRLPPLGRVVVYGDGIDTPSLQKALAALNAKPGIQAEALEGGYAAWLSSARVMQRKRTLEIHDHHQLTYQKLQALAAVEPALVLVDVRSGVDKTPLSDRFGNVTVIRPQAADRSYRGVLQAMRAFSADLSKNLFVIIDDGDGTAGAIIEHLHAASVKRVALLVGGEIALRTEGRVSQGTQVFEKNR